MKDEEFLKKLIKEEKIKLVEPNRNIAEAYIVRSEKSMASAKVLLEKDLLEDSVGHSYYSMYHHVLALFFRVGIKCENHTGAILLLKVVFARDNSVIAFAKKERVDKQYYVDFSVTKEQTIDLIKVAEKFNNETYAFMDTMGTADINLFRKRFEQLL